MSPTIAEVRAKKSEREAVIVQALRDFAAFSTLAPEGVRVIASRRIDGGQAQILAAKIVIEPELL